MVIQTQWKFHNEAQPIAHAKDKFRRARNQKI